MTLEAKMKWHKSYQKQGAESKRTGNRFTVRYPWPGRDPWLDIDITICVPFKTYCHSSACKEVRLQSALKADAEGRCICGENPGITKCPKHRFTGGLRKQLDKPV